MFVWDICPQYFIRIFYLGVLFGIFCASVYFITKYIVICVGKNFFFIAGICVKIFLSVGNRLMILSEEELIDLVECEMWIHEEFESDDREFINRDEGSII